MITGLSKDGLEFLKRHEGFRRLMYADSAGHCTIGYGHLVHKGPPGSDPVSEAPFVHGLDLAQAGLLLAKDTMHASQAVASLIRALAQHEFDALVSFTFNVGVHALEHSTLRVRINSCATPDAIQDAFLMWDKPASLVPRRRDEARLFLTGQYKDQVS